MRPREIALVLALVALACGSDEFVDPSVAITPIRIEPATFERASGERLDVGELRGPYLLHFWASWCLPCRDELPALIEAARGHEGRVVLLGMDEDWAPVRAFFGGTPPAMVAREPAGRVARTLGVRALPDTYLVDAQGRAVRRVGRALDWSRPGYRAWLARMLAAPPEAPR